MDRLLLAPAGSTGNVVGAAVPLPTALYHLLAFQFVVEAAGGSPTVTYKFQGSADGTNWYDIGYVTDISDTVSSATRVRTSVGADIGFLSNPVARWYQYYRVVVTGNNNVTFRAEAFVT
jgi:hypothetical protein